MGYIFIGIVIAIIVGVQIRIKINTKKLIQDYRKSFFEVEKLKLDTIKYSETFPKEHPTIGDIKELAPKPEDEPEITYVGSKEKIEHPLLLEIVNAINRYLLKNRGAVSDFLLVKDIVERNCDAKREEFSVQIPMPLYLGLMGTILGIIIGIGWIAIFGGGFSAFINNPENSIGELMGGVAVAMIASFVGILFTTLNSWDAKGAEASMEKEKNKFYTWIQTELLPSIGGAGNSIATLQQNLLEFNRSFSVNISKMDNALGKMVETYDSQKTLLTEIRSMNIEEMASANVRVLQELQKNMGALAQLNQYLNQVNSFVDAAQKLNSNLNEQLGRTQLIEEMGTFFKEEVKEIEQRKEALKNATTKVDNDLKKTFDELGDHAKDYLKNMTQKLTERENEFRKAIEAQQETMKKCLNESGGIADRFNEQIKNNIDSMSQAIEKNAMRVDEILEKRLKAFADSMEKRENTLLQKLEKNLTTLTEAIKGQNEVLNSLNKQIEKSINKTEHIVLS